MSTMYGGFRFDGVPVALPMRVLREVRIQGDLIPLPCEAESVLGGIDLRGCIVPVLDPARVLGRSASAHGRRHVAIVCVDECLFGLAMDEVTGIFSPLAGTMVPHDVACDGRLYAGSIARADTGDFVAVLATRSLFETPGLPKVQAAVTTTRSTVAGARQHPTLLMRCGGLSLAIDALLVQTTLDRPPVQPSVLTQGHCRGVLEYAGHLIAAVDLSAYCGFEPLPPHQPVQAFVLRLGEGHVAMLVSEVQDVVLPAAEDRVKVSGIGLPRPRLFSMALHARVRWTAQGLVDAAARGLTDEHAPPYLMLSGGTLSADPQLLNLAATNVRLETAVQMGASKRQSSTQAEGTGAVRQHHAAALHADALQVITIDLQREVALPIESVVEILRFTGQCDGLDEGQALMSVMIDRGRSIPLFCLHSLVGLARPPRTADSCVLVVQHEEEWLGFVVPKLRAIEPARRSASLSNGRPSGHDVLAQRLGATDSVVVSSPQGERILRVVDLREVAERLLAEHGAMDETH